MNPDSTDGRIFRRVRHAVLFKNEKIEVICHCRDSDSLPEKIDGINLVQADSLYRQKHGLPFPEEFTLLKERYGISSHRLSEILAMGPNTIKKYERGELPIPAMGRIILSLKDARVFIAYLEQVRSHIGEKEYETLRHNAEERVLKNPKVKLQSMLMSLCPIYRRPSEYNGFRILDFGKLNAVITYLNQRLRLTTESLSRILFYIDSIHYCVSCRSVTGLVYETTTSCGIRPHRWEVILGMMSALKMTHVREEAKRENGDKVEYSALVESTDSNDSSFDFSDSERTAMDKTVSFFRGKSPQEIMAYCLKEPLWLKNKEYCEVLSFQPHAFLNDWLR